MSGSEFCQLLRTAGYQGRLKPEVWQKEFENDSPACSILQWVCHSLTKDNFITQEEYNQYQLLLQGKQPITQISTDNVDSANISCHFENYDDGLEFEIGFQEEQIQLLQQQLHDMDTLTASLDDEQNQIQQELQTFDIEHTLQEADLNYVTSELVKLNERFKESCNKIKASYQTISKLLNTAVNKKQTLPSLIKRANIQDRYEKLSRNLEEWWNKQFMTDLDFDQNDENQKINMNDEQVGDVEQQALLLLFNGLSQQQYEAMQRNLSVLQQCYPRSVSTYVVSQALVKAKQAKLATCQKYLNDVRMGAHQYLEDLNQVENRRTRDLEQLRKKNLEIQEVVLPKVLSEIKEYMCHEVVRADYEFKLARQKYFISKKFKFVEAMAKVAATLHAVQPAIQQELQDWQSYDDGISHAVDALHQMNDNFKDVHQSRLGMPDNDLHMGMDVDESNEHISQKQEVNMASEQSEINENNKLVLDLQQEIEVHLGQMVDGLKDLYTMLVSDSHTLNLTPVNVNFQTLQNELGQLKSKAEELTEEFCRAQQKESQAKFERGQI